MTVFYSMLHEAFLGYAAIFFCLGFAFLFLRLASKGNRGPQFWAASFFLGSAGFVFWSAVIPLSPWLDYAIGEVLHVAGFLLLGTGAYRFTNGEYNSRFFAQLAIWVLGWVASLAFFPLYPFAAGVALKVLRAGFFASTGLMILHRVPAGSLSGRRLTAWSLVGWGGHVFLTTLFKAPFALNLAFGFLVGLQIMAAFGMVTMVLDRTRRRADQSEVRVMRLERFLPICSFCKRIRDADGTWHNVENYISDRSNTEFSHSICPECRKTHYPEFPGGEGR